MPLDKVFTSKFIAPSNRIGRAFSEEELTECRDLLSMEEGIRKNAYVHLKQSLYSHSQITHGQQLFVDKVDSVFSKHARKWSRFADISADIDRIRI